MGVMSGLARWVIAVWCSVLITSISAAFVEFSNCLDETVITSSPRLLQFVPLNISASFNASGYLNVTYYGNVTGQLFPGTYPGPSDASWTNPNNTFGKIVDLEDGANKFTTLFTSFNVLSYTPYDGQPARFCNSSVHGCPLGPAFYENSSDINALPGYTVAHDLGSSYAFSTIEANTRVQSGSERAQFYACVHAYITPDLGTSLRGLLSYLPLGILVVVGAATISAAIFSPWSSVDVFHWSSNYGRDEDILRLVTPGFGDCLQYIQFIVFTGSLSLHYPGFYQPVVSRLGWSTLLFNESLVTGGNGTNAVVDGIYQYRPNSKHGLDRIIQLIGMSSSSDAWADMMVWLVVIIFCVIILTQIGFIFQWIYRQIKDISREDLRSKNWYFSVGNIVRIALGYFLLPLVALSMYQFVIASLGPTYAVALAAVILILIIVFAGWLSFMFARYSPRSNLFDDLQLVLLYGPLYNTYRDDAATFALVPIFVNFLRGIAIGAVQDSGIAQIVVLAICEVIMILTLNFIRPYPSATSMNVYQTCFSVIRLLSLMLSITFVPALDVSSASRGWIGYIILLIHACVLIFGFFLNAIQTLIEVIARLAGAGGHGARDAARGGLVKVFGMRQLSRRQARNSNTARNSMGSNAQMLRNPDLEKDDMTVTRTRSQSASTNLLLEGNRRHRGSEGLDDYSAGQQTPEGMSTISRLSRTFVPGSLVGISKHEAKDKYFRPPRRNTNDFATASGRPRLNSDNDKEVHVVEEAIDDAGEGSSHNRTDTDGPDENGIELTKSKTDYAVREVDFYYGIRGGPLSGSGGTRKMKTGPADPEGTVSSAREWFKGVMKGKTKEKGKGFEVVRSSKAPPGLFPPPVEAEPVSNTEPALSEQYKDRAGSTTERPRTRDSFSTAGESYVSPIPRSSNNPPALPAIDTVGGIELPSRIGSEASRKRPRPVIDNEELPAVPPLPRKSSRRNSSPAARPEDLTAPLPTAAPSESPIRTGRDTSLSSSPRRLPFTRTASNRASNRNSVAVSEISSYMDEPIADEDEEFVHPAAIERPGSVGFVNQHRASDNIRYSPHEAQIPRLSTVEYGYQPAQQQTQPAQHAQSTQPAQPTQPTQSTASPAPDPTWSPAWNGSSAYPADGSKRFSRFRD